MLNIPLTLSSLFVPTALASISLKLLLIIIFNSSIFLDAFLTKLENNWDG